jgi:peroxiredoxin Q/BCP
MGQRLTVGDEAPALVLAASDGSTVDVASFRGQYVVVYFYPKAMSAGCTTEACDFQESLEPLRTAGYNVIGVSPDPADKLQEFAAANGLTFPLVSDPDRSTTDAWGALGEKVKDGQTVIGLLRSTVVVDPEGRVALALYDVPAVGHVAELRKQLQLG